MVMVSRFLRFFECDHHNGFVTVHILFVQNTRAYLHGSSESRRLEGHKLLTHLAIKHVRFEKIDAVHLVVNIESNPAEVVR